MKKQLIVFALLGIFALAEEQCPENSFLKDDKCVCKAGYYSESADKCLKCPDNTTSFPGLYYNTYPEATAGDCRKCQNNYYVTGKATKEKSATCSKCPDHSINRRQLEDVQTEAEACTECEYGYYWDNSSGKRVCSPCGSEGAIPADKEQTGKNPSFCNNCQAGYFMTKAADEKAGTAAQCSKCPEYSGSTIQTDVGSIANCSCEDRLAEKLSESVQTCKCKAGYAGQVSNSSAVSGCEVACAENASKYDGKCACKKGYYGINAAYGGKCEKCPELTISNQCHRGDCNTGEERGKITSCNSCIENYYIVEFAGGFGPDAKAATCKACPENSYNEEGGHGFCKCFDKYADSLNYSSTKCECKYGYTGNVATTKDGTGCVKEGSSNSGSSGSNSNSGSSGNSSSNSGSSGNSNNNSGTSGNGSSNSGSSGNNNNSGSSINNENSGKKDKETSESQSINVNTNSANLQILALMMQLAILI
ncbi:immobilization antigen (macronuclear) [Tetrahymena thermophila SB210]|uniref:Immobilization antigen n=1 Tax=Tetrahymena thermophila (strain SB210) TaxID=312017 RepID=Q23JR7_TETTS|nr:immobilization antigen [Tetrahymena thermophila SB210]EAR96793.1 immobilization antigen [Tetrahymena thermophila SB210]|eukprot:XP_001017038.1 immobilization antigen [Tetrahymena thermophila SB210]